MQSNIIQRHIKKAESIRSNAFNDVEKRPQNNDDIKLETFSDVRNQKGVTTNEILETSQMIKVYCKTYMKPLMKFLTEFKEYAKKCGLNYTVNNVSFYIKRKMVKEELQMVSNYTKTLSFINLNSVNETAEKNECLNYSFRKKMETARNKEEKMKENQLKLLSSLDPLKLHFNEG